MAQAAEFEKLIDWHRGAPEHCADRHRNVVDCFKVAGPTRWHCRDISPGLGKIGKRKFLCHDVTLRRCRCCRYIM
jgi:hypothetical protein